jgi:hypothetical protein
MIAGFSLGLNYIPTSEPDFSPSPHTVETTVLDFARRLFSAWNKPKGKPPPFYPTAKTNTQITCASACPVAMKIIRYECHLAARFMKNQALAWLSTENHYKKQYPARYSEGFT